MARPLDPSGILARVPELEPLASEPGIHRAIERGSPRAVYRALFWARWLGKLKGELQRREADALLGNRRLFLEPLAGRAPVMSTLNGIGTTIYGREEQGDDGAYVTTLFFVVFFVPVIPLGAYLVADAGGRSYRFFGKAPLGSFSYLWGMLLLLAASGAAVFGMGSALWASRHATLYVVDGLPVPVVATIGDARIEVAAESQGSLVLGTGSHVVTITTLDGRTLETGTLEARAGEDVLAWNVLGAAPLYREDVIYGSSLYQPTEPPEPELACGRTDVHWSSVDYAFVDPPSSIQLDSRYGTETRSHAEVAPGGYRLCAALLASRRQYAESVALITHVAGALGPTDGATVSMLAELAVRLGASIEDVLPMLRTARDGAPGDVDAQRAYQDAMVALGRRDEVRAEYEARASADPGSADAAYLAVRLATGDSLEAVHALADRFPSHGYLQRAYGYGLYDAHRCDDALAVWAGPGAGGPGADTMALGRAECLVHVGRAGEAAALLEEMARRVPESAEPLAPAYAAAARAGGADDPGLVLSLADFTDDPGGRLRARIASGLAVDHDELAGLEGVDRDLAEIYWVASGDPDRALSLAGSLPLPAVRRLPEPLFVLLYGEALRRDPSSATAASLAAASPLGPAPLGAIRTFVTTGAEGVELRELYPDVRAAAWLVRSRAAGSAEERARMVDRVAEDDLLGGWAARATTGWPAAEPTSS